MPEFSLSGLRRLFAPNYEFSAADQQMREAMMLMSTPEQMKSLDQTQQELWRNDFNRSMPLTMRPGKFGDEHSRMPTAEPYRMPGISAEAAQMRSVPDNAWVTGGPRTTMGSPEYPLSDIWHGRRR